MSERAYEDGTPAAYEPKVEPWMHKLAVELLRLAFDSGMVELERGAHFVTHEPTQDFIDSVARLVAQYSPNNDKPPHWHLKRAYALLFKAGPSDPVLMEACAMIDDAHRLITGKDEPRPIRRGDVVQMVKPLHEDYFDRHQVSIVMAIEDDRANLYYGGWQPIANLVRIGRARYYPDGIEVEN